MRLAISAILVLELANPAFALGSLHARAQPREDGSKAEAVKKAFDISWKGYRDHAFPNDTLRPQSNGSKNDRNGWGATIVDALSTAIVMGEAAIVNQALDDISKIDFTTTREPSDISVFETTIRYLGGLISGHDLLTGPMRNLVSDSSKTNVLLTQAKKLADSLSIAFSTTTGIPDGTVMLNPSRRINGSAENSLAGIGTLILEWTRLSDLSGNKSYGELAKKGQSFLLKPQGIEEPWPGLVGTQVSIQQGTFQDSNGGWGAFTDSFYEYLIKMYQYDPREFAEYKDRWVQAADSTIQHLQSHPTTREDLVYLSQYSGKQTIPTSSHLASFAGGNFILGGALLNQDKYKDFGLRLAESYFNNYNQTTTGIGPEGFRWVDGKLSANDKNNEQPSGAQREFYQNAGFFSTSGFYILRPETVESLYYAYRLTGDSKWQDMAWQAFRSVNATCRTGSAYAALRDVTKPQGDGFVDDMESFWMAETLKYFYLIFAPESDVQLQLQGGESKFVFNTEAHPVRLRACDGCRATSASTREKPPPMSTFVFVFALGLGAGWLY